MSLETIVDNSRTDKNTTHSYLPLYNSLLYPLKEKAQNVLEIGIGDFGPNNGGSIIMWNNFFPNATVYGIDTLSEDRVLDELKNNNKVVLYTSTDGYNYNFIKREFIDKNIKFDFIIDDGAHTLESMILFINFYSELMSDDSILIIEDVQDYEWFNLLKKATPIHLQNYINIYDLRSLKGRYDDLVFTIDKRKL
jgi:cephalosporin hydroxylase